jgi:hypothetical protein
VREGQIRMSNSLSREQKAVAAAWQATREISSPRPAAAGKGKA